MNNADNGNMPASPVLHSIDGNWAKEPLDEYKGLTKREHFAAMAKPPVEIIIEVLKTQHGSVTLEAYLNMAAEYKTQEADALLAALK